MTQLSLATPPRATKKYFPIVRVQLIREGSIPQPEEKVTSPSIAYQVLSEYLEYADREHFIILLLNTKNGIIGINTVSIGSLSSSIVHPREIFKPAILANAAGIILAHNHPSGDPSPSQEDLEVTRRLVEAGQLLGIIVQDHIIIGDGCYVSLKEKGFI